MLIFCGLSEQLFRPLLLGCAFCLAFYREQLFHHLLRLSLTEHMCIATAKGEHQHDPRNKSTNGKGAEETTFYFRKENNNMKTNLKKILGLTALCLGLFTNAIPTWAGEVSTPEVYVGNRNGIPLRDWKHGGCALQYG